MFSDKHLSFILIHIFKNKNHLAAPWRAQSLDVLKCLKEKLFKNDLCQILPTDVTHFLQIRDERLALCDARQIRFIPDYLLSSFGQTSAMGLYRLVDGDIFHDSISRFLSGNEFTSKVLWQKVKPLVCRHETADACLIFDDVIIEKPYTDENDMVCWHWGHSKKRPVKGVNMLNAFYHTQGSGMDKPLRLPIGF